MKYITRVGGNVECVEADGEVKEVEEVGAMRGNIALARASCTRTCTSDGRCTVKNAV